MSRNPCKSPACTPERDRTASRVNDAVGGCFAVRRDFSCASAAIAFLALVLPFFFVASFLGAFFFGARLAEITFLPAARVTLFAFLPFFLAAIHAV